MKGRLGGHTSKVALKFSDHYLGRSTLFQSREEGCAMKTMNMYNERQTVTTILDISSIPFRDPSIDLVST